MTNPNNFHSLLFYFGLLSFGESKKNATYLNIPNQTVYQLMYGFIRDALKETDCFRIDIQEFSDLIYEMAFDGEWKGVFDFLAEEIKQIYRHPLYLDFIWHEAYH